jgi:hypothetical protein
MLPLLTKPRLLRGAVALGASVLLVPATASALPFKPLDVLAGDAQFGAVTVGQPASRTLTLKSAGELPVVIEGGNVTLTPGPATIAGDSCTGKVLSNGAECKVTLTYAPVAAGDTTQELKVAYDGNALKVPVTGTGVAAPVAPTPVPPTPPAPPIIISPPVAPITFTKADAAQLATKADEIKIKSNGKITLPITCPAGVDCTVKASLTIPKGEITGNPVSDTSKRTRSLGEPITLTLEPNQALKTNVQYALFANILKIADRHDVDEMTTTVKLLTKLANGQEFTYVQAFEALLPS